MHLEASIPRLLAGMALVASCTDMPVAPLSDDQDGGGAGGLTNTGGAPNDTAGAPSDAAGAGGGPEAMGGSGGLPGDAGGAGAAGSSG
jgi:hypothetical protein